MPYKVSIEGGVVVSKYSGDVTIGEIQRAREEIQSLPGFGPELSHIFDFGDARVDQVSTQAVEDLMRVPSAASPLALQIVVVPGDDELRRARMFQRMGPSTGRTILVVRSRAEAQATLDSLSRKAGLPRH